MVTHRASFRVSRFFAARIHKSIWILHSVSLRIHSPMAVLVPVRPGVGVIVDLQIPCKVNQLMLESGRVIGRTRMISARRVFFFFIPRVVLLDVILFPTVLASLETRPSLS